MLFSLKDTTVETINPKEQDEEYVESTCPTCGGDWEQALFLLKSLSEMAIVIYMNVKIMMSKPITSLKSLIISSHT